MSNLRREADAAGNYRRIQGVATEQSIAEGVTILHKITATNANGSVQTITVADGPSSVTANVLGVYELPVDDSRTLHFNLKLNTGLTVTPSDSGIDALVIFDAALVIGSGAGVAITIDVEDAITISEVVDVLELILMVIAEDAVTVGENDTIQVQFNPMFISTEDAVSVGEFRTVVIS